MKKKNEKMKKCTMTRKYRATGIKGGNIEEPIIVEVNYTMLD